VRIIVTDRMTGKTYKMMMWLAADKNRVGVVHSEAERDRLYHLYEGTIKKGQLITLSGIKAGALRGRHLDGIAVDNLDLMLSDLFDRQRVSMITMTGQAET